MKNDDKKIRKNKDHLFTSTVRSKQTVSENNARILNDIIVLFNQQKRHWFNYNDHSPLGRKNFIHKQAQLIGKMPYNYRFFQGIRQDIQGMNESIKSNSKNYLVEKEALLKNINKKINMASKKYKNSLKNKEKLNLNDIDIEKQLFSLRQRYRKKYNLENRINSLKNNEFSLCFGGKKLLKQRHSLKTNEEIELWKEQWFDKRHEQVLFVGSHDETQGNMNCQLRYKDDKFSLKIRIPYCMEDKYQTESIILENIQIPKKYKESVLNEVLKHQSKDDERNALSFRIIRHKDNQFYIHIGLNSNKKEIVTSNYNGLIGVDINPDHLAVIEIDGKGNFLNSLMLPMDLENKSTGQRKNIIYAALHKLKDYALLKQKDIVIENLNFKQKRSALSSNNNPQYARMLSGFAYQQIIQGIQVLGYKHGINIKMVNPAYTSLLGEIKYSTQLGLSTHMSAAYVIARRGYEYKEKLKKLFHTTRKGEVFTLHVPEGIQTIQQFTRWYRGQFRKIEDITKLPNFVEQYVPHKFLNKELCDSKMIPESQKMAIKHST